MVLFGLVTLALCSNLIGLEAGVPIAQGIFPAQAYVDDVALPSSSREGAQTALNVASSWADSILMRLNIGVVKTAALRGLVREPMVQLRVHGQPLPEVDSYRYLGGFLHCGQVLMGHCSMTCSPGSAPRLASSFNGLEPNRCQSCSVSCGLCMSNPLQSFCCQQLH